MNTKKYYKFIIKKQSKNFQSLKKAALKILKIKNVSFPSFLKVRSKIFLIRN